MSNEVLKPSNKHTAHLLKSDSVKYYIEKENSKFVKSKIKNISFTNQRVNEEVFIVVRSHWFINLGWIYRAFINSLIPFLLYYIANLLNFDFFNPADVFFYLVFYYSIILTNTFREFIDWYFDPYFVTNDRIIHYDFKPFVSYKIQEVYFDNIEEVKEISSGFFSNIFGYGDIKINTASDHGEFILKKVPNPTSIRNIISDISHIKRNSKQ